jgi:Cu+-exporting ATPase
MAEKNSEHPSVSHLCGAEERGLKVSEPESFNSIPGHGVEAKAAGSEILLGNRKLMTERGVGFSALMSQAEALEADGKTVMFVALKGQAAGLIAVADTLKEYSADAIRRLHKLGLEVAMITGDNRRTADRCALVLIVYWPRSCLRIRRKRSRNYKHKARKLRWSATV